MLMRMVVRTDSMCEIWQFGPVPQMEGLQNVAFLVVATTKNILFGLDDNLILTAQPNIIATKLDTYAPDAYCNTS